jgi:hypothetical protein
MSGRSVRERDLDVGKWFWSAFSGIGRIFKVVEISANTLGGSRSRDARYEREGLGCWDCCASFSRTFGLGLKPRWSTTKVQDRYKTMGVKGQRDLVHLRSATFLQSSTPPTAVTRQSQLVWATHGTLKRTERSIKTASRIEKLAVYQNRRGKGMDKTYQRWCQDGGFRNAAQESSRECSKKRKSHPLYLEAFLEPRNYTSVAHSASSSISRAGRVRRPSIPCSATCAQQTSNSRSLSLQASVHGLSSDLYLSIKLIQYSRTQNRRRL